MKTKTVSTQKPFGVLGRCSLCALMTLFLLGLGLRSAHSQTLSNGGSYDGIILLNQTNSWTFTASSGDSVVLRGGYLTSTNYFNPWLRLYNPSGTLIAATGSGSSAQADELAITATNNGSY